MMPVVYSKNARTGEEIRETISEEEAVLRGIRPPAAQRTADRARRADRVIEQNSALIDGVLDLLATDTSGMTKAEMRALLRQRVEGALE